MMPRPHASLRSVLLATLLTMVGPAAAALAAGATALFDGKSLAGWKSVGASKAGIAVTNGLLVFQRDAAGAVFTEKTYENFALRFEFRAPTNATGGIAVRAPFYGDPAVTGLKIVVADDQALKDAPRASDRGNGSLSGITGAHRGAQRPTGEWNTEEIRLEGRWLSVTLNNREILTLNLNEQRDPAVLGSHPGLLRPDGHIGFVAEGSVMEFRNITVEELPSNFTQNNQPPYPGFLPLYNGVNLSGWQGTLAAPHNNPHRRTSLPPAELKRLQATADAEMQAHWKSADGAIVFDGQGAGLASVDTYQNFELFVDWKAGPGTDAGVYLRGYPQVQIQPGGSGGLSQNLKGPAKPLLRADRDPGQWNRFQILLLGDRATVFLNGELVVQNVIFENAWERGLPLLDLGPIEFAPGKAPIHLRNIHLRPLL